MKITAFCLCWLLILTAPGVMAQQPAAPFQSWDVLRQLQAGDKLQVEKKAGKKKRSGKMVSLSDTELVIERKGKNESFMRDDVRRVWQVDPPNRLQRVRSTSAWGGVGFLLGAITGIGIALGGSCSGGCEDENAAVIGVMIGLPVAGALIGYFTPGDGKRTLIYSAP
jgi:hypothetical protein